MKRSIKARVVGSVSAVALVTGLTAGLTVLAGAAPSDNRAVEVPGNVTTCAAAGFPDSVQVGSPSNSNASDANVSGVVKTNAGITNPGQGEELDVTLLTGTVVIDAVIVKGGPNYNLYTDAQFLPPTLPPDQHYIAPLVGAGNVPTISHWFVCYSLGAPPETGELLVTKVVAAPDGTPVSPLPTGYTATVTCQFEEDAPTVHLVSFGAGGGVGVAAPPLTGLAIGTVCTVVEDGTAGFPAGTVVTYDPEGADVDGVEIPDSDEGVTVEITNDFPDVQVEAETVVNPPLAPAPIVAAPIVVASPALTG